MPISCNKNKIKKITKKLTFLFFLIFFLIFSFSSVAFSQTTTENGDGAITGAESEAETVSLDNPLGETETIPGMVGNITTTLLSIVGSLALLAFVVGGVRWLISGGKPEQIKKGANTMLYAIIGLFVVFGSYAILTLIIETLTGAR